MEGSRLQMIGDQEREARISNLPNREKKKQFEPARIISPTLVVKHTDNYTTVAASRNQVQRHGGRNSNVNQRMDRIGQNYSDTLDAHCYKLPDDEIQRHGGRMSNGVDARAFEEMGRQHAEMSRRLEQTMDLVRQMHAHSATTAAQVMRMASNEDLSAITHAPPAPPPIYTTGGGTGSEREASAQLGYRSFASRMALPASTRAREPSPPPRTLESRPGLVHVEVEKNQFYV